MSLTSLKVGLKASYNFDGDFKDRSGNNNHGTSVNGASIDTDNQKHGSGCLLTDGVNQYMSIPSQNHDEITVAFFLNRASIQAPGNTDTFLGGWFFNADIQLREGYDVARFPSTDDRTVCNFTLLTETGGVRAFGSIQADIGDTVGEQISIIASYNKTTGKQKFFIAGKLVAITSHTPGSTVVPLTSFADMRIGHSRVNNAYAHGYVDTLYFWSRPLLDGGVTTVGEYAGEEVAEIYNKDYGLELTIEAPPTRTGKPVIDGQREPLGYQQITGLNTVKGLTVPEGTRLAVIQPETEDVRWMDDGTNPTSSVGISLAAGEEKRYTGDFSAIKFIETAASAKLNVSYYS